MVCEGSKGTELPLNFHRVVGSSASKGVVLDLGTGTGKYLKYLGPDAVGIDIDRERLKSCNGLGNGVVLCNANGTLPFADACFDSVLASHVIEHVSSPLNTLREVSRVLKPGGKLYVALPTEKSIVRMIHDKYFLDHKGHLYGFTPQGFRSLLNSSGFRVDRVLVDLIWGNHRLMMLPRELANKLPSAFIWVSTAYWVCCTRLGTEIGSVQR